MFILDMTDRGPKFHLAHAYELKVKATYFALHTPITDTFPGELGLSDDSSCLWSYGPC